VAPLVVLMLAIGLAPNFLYERVNPSVQQVVELVDQQAPVASFQESRR
jgi:NADH:ubiquinone oxidoreductase subunit 4 (subunit M)